MMAITHPSDEIVVFALSTRITGPDAILSGATPRFVDACPPETRIPLVSRKELARIWSAHEAITQYSNNPTGKVLTRAELEFNSRLCVRWNAFCITDEFTSHILYDGAEHIPWRALMDAERTIVIMACPKRTASPAGGRLGYAPPDATHSIRKVHGTFDRWRGPLLAAGGSDCVAFAA